MNADIVKDIAEYLEDQSVGTVGTDMFVGMVREDVNNAVLLIGTSSGIQEPYYDIYEEVIDIYSRNQSSEDSYSKFQEVFNVLHRLSNTETDNAYIYFAHSLEGVVDAGRDTNDRSLYRGSFRIIYRDKTIS